MSFQKENLDTDLTLSQKFIDLNLKQKIIKLLKGSIGETLGDFGFATIPKTQYMTVLISQT